jgi:colanic acid/amylovoran biosynthesis protein
MDARVLDGDESRAAATISEDDLQSLSSDVTSPRTAALKETDRLAIIVPGSTDLNRGDQALVWEAAAFARETGWFDDIAVLDPESDSDTASRNAARSAAAGLRVLPSLLLDPRRGRHHANDKVRERLTTTLTLIMNSLWDLVVSALVLCLAPYGRAARWLLTPHQWLTLQAIRRSRLMIVKGGGFLHAWGGIRAPYYIWYQLFYMRLAHRLGIPVCVLPNSFGPFEGWTVRGQMRRVMSRCGYIAARESISAAALGEVLGREIPVVPDMGYFLKPAPGEVGGEICLRSGVPLGQKRCVGITIRPWRFPGAADPEARFNDYLIALVEFTRHLVRRGFHPVFIAQVLGPGAHENDNLAIDALVARLGDIPFSRVNYAGDCTELKSVYGCMDFVVGTRFHSVIFAQGMSCPSLAISYGGNKGQGIMGDLGLGQYVIPIEEVTSAGLISSFDKLVENADGIRRRMDNWMLDARRRRLEMLCEVQAKFGAAQQSTSHKPNAMEATKGVAGKAGEAAPNSQQMSEV